MSQIRLVALAGVAVAALAFGAVAALGLFDDSGAVDEPGVVGDTAADAGADRADGDRPPVIDTTFEHFDGSVVSLADWQGTPVVVNFWASWCPPCVAEMRAAFEPVHQELGDEVAFVGLNLEDDPERAAEIVDRTGVTYDLGRDPAGELFTGFGGFGMPTTIFLDETGQIVDSHTGALSRSQLEDLIARHLDVGGA